MLATISATREFRFPDHGAKFRVRFVLRRDDCVCCGLVSSKRRTSMMRVGFLFVAMLAGGALAGAQGQAGAGAQAGTSRPPNTYNPAKSQVLEGCLKPAATAGLYQVDNATLVKSGDGVGTSGCQELHDRRCDSSQREVEGSRWAQSASDWEHHRRREVRHVEFQDGVGKLLVSSIQKHVVDLSRPR
jgi:hypothetical protein